MNLYKLTQDTIRGYDTYDSAVVSAETEEQARNMHPDGITASGWELNAYPDWPKAEYVSVELLGTAVTGTKPGVIVASYNAG